MKKYGRIGIKKGLKILMQVLFVCLAALTFTSCGGGDGGGSGNPAGAPPVIYIESASPKNDYISFYTEYSKNIPVNTKVTVTFSEALDASTITTTTFSVAGVTGSVTYNATNLTATFTPTSELSYGTTYTVTVTSGVAGEAGNAMEPYTWTFTTTRWRTAAVLNTSAGTTNASSPQIAFDTNGNSLAVWAQGGIYANYYTAGTGWGTASIIGTNAGGSSYDPQIAFDSNGNAIAVWSQYTNPYTRIYANYYTSGAGWGTAKIIDKNVIYASSSSPQISFDSNGNAVAIWYQWDGYGYNIYTNYYTAGVGWGTASLIENNSGYASSPQIAFDTNGNAIVVWIQDDGTYDSIYANYFTAGVGWGTANLIENNTGNAYVKPQIAFDANGNAMAVWVQENNKLLSIYAIQYTTGAGWGTAKSAMTTPGNIESPRIAFDKNGNALAVWSDWINSDDSIFARFYTAGAGWGKTVSQIENYTGSADSPQIAFDANNNALAVWMQYDNARKYSDIYASEFR